MHTNGEPVTDEEKRQRAREIAGLLCDHSKWKTHSRGINCDVASDECKLKIARPEDIDGLHDAIRSFWALMYWIYENTTVYKVFVSNKYCIFRNDISRIAGGNLNG